MFDGNNVLEHVDSTLCASNDDGWRAKLKRSEELTGNTFEDMANKRKRWEANAYARSNEELYGLLSECYDIYETMCSSSSYAETLRKSLKDFMEEHKVKCNKNSHNLIKIVKCVFGTADARRVSTYSVALRAAAQAGVKAAGLKQFIKDKGGVQELRVAKQNALSAADKAAKAKHALTATTLAEVRSDALLRTVDMSNVGELVVLVATQQADGVFALHAVTASTTAVNAALTAYYSNNKAVITRDEKTIVITENEDAKRELTVAAVQ